MRLDLTELLQEPGRAAEYLIHEDHFVDEDLECVSPIEGKVVFTNTGGLLLLRGSAETSAALPCSRCTEYFEMKIGVEISEEFELEEKTTRSSHQPVVTVKEEDENPITEKLFDGYIFNLSELLRQLIMVEIPLSPMPPEDDGRCVHCKKTKAEVLGTLVIAPEEHRVHPGFAVLTDLLADQAVDSAD